MAEDLQEHLEAQGGILVIVHHEDPLSRGVLRLRIDGFIRVDRRQLLAGKGQADRKLAPLPFPRVLGLHAASMHLDQSLDQRQPDAQPRLGTFPRPIGLREHVQNVRQQIGGDADARVGTEIETWSPSRETTSQICPPGSVYLAALLRMLATTCDNRTASPSTVNGSGGNFVAN